MSLRVLWDSIYGLCQVSVHREGVNPSSMEGVLDLSDHISDLRFGLGLGIWTGACQLLVLVADGHFSIIEHSDLRTETVKTND